MRYSGQGKGREAVVLCIVCYCLENSAKLCFCLHAISLLVGEEPLRGALV